MVRDRPLAGFGLGTWSDAYPAYAHFDDGNFVNQAHNDWVQWAAEGGVPFFLIMLAIAALTVRPAIRSLWGSRADRGAVALRGRLSDATASSAGGVLFPQ